MAENEKQVAQTEQTEPTEKKQETEEEKREREKEEAECLNRQINYFIMRHMWQVVRGRKHEDGDTIYAAFNTSRERYTRIINTGIVRYGKGELDGLEQTTGLRKEIFTGEVRFKCPYVVKTNINGKQANIIKEDITEGEWKALFIWRKKRINDNGDKAGKTCQDEIYSKLKCVPRDDIDNWDFYRLCFYLKNLKAAPLRASTGKLREIEESIKQLSFSLLDGCQVGQLQRFQKLLKDKQTLISAMVTYKNAQDAERKNK